MQEGMREEGGREGQQRSTMFFSCNTVYRLAGTPVLVIFIVYCCAEFSFFLSTM